MLEKNKMSMHEPEGRAAVNDESGGYHVDRDNVPVYKHRFKQAYGFYCGLASVVDDLGFFHIDVDGDAVHEKRFLWSGNYQNNLCVVQSNEGYYHVDIHGQPVYSERFDYIGDYRYQIAVAYKKGRAFHVDEFGERLYEHNFEYAEPFHKGCAVVRDQDGFYHVDVDGLPIHDQKLKRAEPFYNDVAFCELPSGQLVRLRENGDYSLVSTLQVLTYKELASKVTLGAKAVALVRHAEREEITADTPNWGNDVKLTENGIIQCQRFAQFFKSCGEVRFISSEVPRCVQTAHEISVHLSSESNTETCSMLGNPGVFFDGTGSHESPMSEGSDRFWGGYLATGVAPGMIRLSDAAEKLKESLLGRLKKSNLTIAVSHDFHVAAFRQFLGLPHLDKQGWCEYLEGIVLIQERGRLSYALLVMDRES